MASAIIPHLDNTYAAAHPTNGSSIRPNLLIPPSTSGMPNSSIPIDPGNNDCEAHPAFSVMQPVFNANAFLALHQVGNRFRTGSHFEDMRQVETAVETCDKSLSPLAEEGWVSRMAPTLPNPTGFEAASVSQGLQQFFQTQNPFQIQAHIPSIRVFQDDSTAFFSLASSKPGIDAKLRGTVPNPLVPFSGNGLRAHTTWSIGDSPNGILGRSVGGVMLAAEPQITGLGGTYGPQGGAVYPFNDGASGGVGPFGLPSQFGLPDAGWAMRFFQQLRDAIWLLRSTSVRCVGVELGGWDTHSAQGIFSGRFNDRLSVLLQGMRSVWDDSQNQPSGSPEDIALSNLTTMVVSEFGRTSRENSNLGTDHGAATCAFVMGTRVILNPNALLTNGMPIMGGSRIYNCDMTTWQNGTFLGAVPQDFACDGTPGPFTGAGNGTMVAPVWDYKEIFAELINKVFCPTVGIDTILPGFTASGLTQRTFLT